MAACDGFEGAVNEANAEFILSASRQGEWRWTLYLVEVERNKSGRWEGLR